MDALTIIAIWIVVAFNYVRFRDPLYPPFVQAAIWASVFTLYAVWDSELWPITPYTQLIMAAGVVMFSLGGAVATLGHRPAANPAPMPLAKAQNVYLLVLLIAAWILLLPYYRRGEELSAGGIGYNALIALRFALTEEGEGFGVLAYALPVSLFCTLGHLLFCHRFGAPRLLAATAPTLVYAGMFAGRTVLFTALIAGLAVLAITRRIRLAKAFVVFMVAGGIAFVSIGVALNKSGSYDDSLWENIPGIVESAESYLFGGTPAFDSLRERAGDPEWGIHTFRSALAFAKTIGVSGVEVVPMVKEFVLVPMPTNVYTVYQPYYQDFGIAGVLVFLFGFGFAHSRAYRRAVAQKASTTAVIVYALMMYPLFMQFFQDTYFSLLSFWMQIGLLTAILHGVGRVSLPRVAIRPARAGSLQ